MKVVINSCYGGFSLSPEAYDYLGLSWKNGYGYAYRDGDDKERAAPELVKCVEELGSSVASGWLSKLKVVEIPDDVKWHIEEYDGIEWVAEDHRTWS